MRRSRGCVSSSDRTAAGTFLRSATGNGTTAPPTTRPRQAMGTPPGFPSSSFARPEFRRRTRASTRRGLAAFESASLGPLVHPLAQHRRAPFHHPRGNGVRRARFAVLRYRRRPDCGPRAGSGESLDRPLIAAQPQFVPGCASHQSRPATQTPCSISPRLISEMIVRDGNKLDRQFLGLIGSGLGNELGVADDDRRDPLSQQSGVRRDCAEQFGRVAGVAGFFQKLASACRARIFPGLDQASRRFEAVAMQSSAKLADQDDLLRGRNSHDVDAVCEIGDVEIMGFSALLRSKSLATQAKQPVVEECLIDERPRRR